MKISSAGKANDLLERGKQKRRKKKMMFRLTDEEALEFQRFLLCQGRKLTLQDYIYNKIAEDVGWEKIKEKQEKLL